MIRTVIVDDEPLARQGLRLRLAKEADVSVIGEAADGHEAVRLIEATLPDLVFLDVQMPGMSGFQVLEQVVSTHIPVVVFVTAYDQYALKAFEVRAMDYLLKPFTQERFDEALRRARRELGQREEEHGSSRMLDLVHGGAEPYLTRLAVRARDRFVLVRVEDVDWVQAAANYVEVHAGGKTYLLRSTISSLEQRLDPARFVRIHRSFLVNADRVAEIRSDAHGDYEVMLAGGRVLRMTRNYSARLLK